MSTGNRDDFSAATKKILADRAGYRCSYLGCGKPTIGPSDESATASSSIGMAAHIAAAAGGKGARRYLSSMTKEQRVGIDNGIWMCANHGKIVDTDEKRFSIAMLQQWKLNAEYIARIMQDKNYSYEKALRLSDFTDFVSDSILIKGMGEENQLIGDALQDCGVSVAWGAQLAHATRDFIIEHIRNAFIHGKATFVQFSSAKNRLIITDDGSVYNPKNLPDEETRHGGADALEEMLKKYDTEIIIATNRSKNQNITTIVRLIDESDIIDISPCVHKISYSNFRSRRDKAELTIKEDCSEIFVILPTYISPSDVGMVVHSLEPFKNDTRPFTFITNQMSDLVKGYVKGFRPNCHIVELSLSLK